MREIAERKETKADQSLHSDPLMQEMEWKKREDPAFSQRAPLERSPALTVTWSDVWKVLHLLSDG